MTTTNCEPDGRSSVRSRRGSATAAIRGALAVALVASALTAPTSQPAAAATESVSGPTGRTISLTETGPVSVSGFVLTAFSTDVLVSVIVTGGTGAELAIPAANRGSLALASGITVWEGSAELSFRGSMADANAALAAMTLDPGTAEGTLTLSVDAVADRTGLTYDAASGSFYEYVIDDGVDRGAAKTGAESRTFAGRTGHLVTITSASEQAFVSQRIQGASNIWIGATDSGKEGVWYWDSGPEANKVFWRLDDPCVTPPASETDPDYTEYTSTCPAGTRYASSPYTVTTGTEITFANWCSGEPNNSDGSTGEHHAVTNWNGGTCWNDLRDGNTFNIDGYVVEYSEPSSGATGVVTASATYTVTAAALPPESTDEVSGPVSVAVEQAAALEGTESVLVRGSVPVPVTTTISRDAGPRGGLVIEDETKDLTVTVTSAAGVSETAGVVVPESGEVVCEICARLAAGSVVEAWVYSEPRLTAAVRVEVDAEEGTCPLLRIPTGTPLDGGGAIEAGAHTLQLRMYTEDGFEVLAFPITVGAPVPTSVPSGEGPALPGGLLAGVAGLAVVAGLAGLRRRSGAGAPVITG